MKSIEQMHNEKQAEKLIIQEIWNKELETFKREPKERNYISASDLGKSYLDRWLKMKGIPETNPFEPRIMRIFSAGEQFHWLIRKVFEKIGLLINAEQMVKIPTTEKTLTVIGYYDLLIGGKVDKQKGLEAIKSYEFSPFIEQRAISLLNFFAEEYPNGFEPVICENKSVHSNAFWGFQEGKEKIEKSWNKDIETISKYFLENIEPPKEPDMVFDETKKKWVANWKVERSPYLTRITGCKDKNEWLKRVKEQIKEIKTAEKEEKILNTLKEDKVREEEKVEEQLPIIEAE